MLRVVMIGGSGHIGSYLVPRLVRAGHEVIHVSRSLRKPYLDHPAWKEVQQVTLQRQEEDPHAFAKQIQRLRPDVVIDNICFTPESAGALAETLAGHIRHLLVTGTIWVHGRSEVIPTPEEAKRKPFGEYGVNKNEIEALLLERFHSHRLPVTILHPGHIVGEGWPCLNPQGHFNLNVFQTIIDGKTLLLPHLGMECVHHVHADDVAQGFELCIDQPDLSIGEGFHLVSEKAVTLRGYAEAAYSWFNREPNLQFTSLAELSHHLSEEDLAQTREHIERSPCMSLEKARKRLGYQPRYSSLEACRESVAWMIQNKKLHDTSSN